MHVIHTMYTHTHIYNIEFNYTATGEVKQGFVTATKVNEDNIAAMQQSLTTTSQVTYPVQHKCNPSSHVVPYLV